MLDWASSVKDGVAQKWSEFAKWWDSWTLGDVFAGIYDSVISLCAKIKQPFIDFKNWILDLFAGLNPFNWELPSWLGGGKTGDNQVRNAETALNSWGIPDITPTKILPPTEPVNIPANLLPPTMPKPQLLTVTPEWAKGMQDLNASMGLNFDVPSIKVPDFTLNAPSANSVTDMHTDVLPAPVVNVAPANPAINISQNVPMLKSPTVSAAQIDSTGISNSLADIEGLLSNVVGRDIEVRPSITPNLAPSSPLLIQHTQNQAAMNGQATVQAQANAPEKTVKVDNHVDVKVESKPVEFYIDSEKVGSAALRWVERQNLRSGVSPF